MSKTDTPIQKQPRLVSIFAVPGVQLLDVAGPLDVFAEANRQCTGRKPIYRFRLVSRSAGPLTCSSGARLLPDATIEDRREKVDTLLVAGSPHAGETHLDAATMAWLTASARTARRYGSVCSGAFLLAQTGGLDGCRVTTHWSVAGALQAAFPKLRVEADSIYVRDGRVCTAAGVTAGMDLALALVEEDLGREVAMNVARELVMFFKRPGGQMPFSRRGQVELSGRSALQESQRWIAAHLRADLSVAALASRAGVSPRHFARMFRGELGVTPADYVESVRVDAACRLLEEGTDAPKQVADRCGFTNVNGLRRAFMRCTGITPAEYRRRYRGESSVG
ncbi:DJ-1/PfpI family protein [Pendulispora brunnea]|uniref:DJ-1/PfpI family protein n=1 Tax=Pendulispora brunnea TaxID=2905690 RepID=A0ABZ2JVF9_9BACT